MRSIPITLVRSPSAASGPEGLLARLGQAMRRHQRVIRATQWLVVVVYAFLVIVPATLPLPPEDARILDNLRLFAQFLFWGIWWPFVMPVSYTHLTLPTNREV